MLSAPNYHKYWNTFGNCFYSQICRVHNYLHQKMKSVSSSKLFHFYWVEMSGKRTEMSVECENEVFDGIGHPQN